MRRIVVLLSVLAVVGCKGQNAESRAREAEQKIRDSMPDVVGRALEQKVSADEVKRAQQALIVLHEYMGEANGVLDPVTINAIQAFQREGGLPADGILTKKTRRRLQEAAAAAGTPTAS